VLLIARFCDPASELYIAEHYYGHTALADLLGIADAKIYENRLYRALDKLVPYKKIWNNISNNASAGYFRSNTIYCCMMSPRLMLRVSSGQSSGATRLFRDKRPDCKQVGIALVVTKEGMPLGYELFAGNRHDSTTVQHICGDHGATVCMADRIWVMDRGMISQQNIAFLKQHNRRYIIGTPRSLLKKFEQQLLAQDCTPFSLSGSSIVPFSVGDTERFMLCRSMIASEKEPAILQRFCQNIERVLRTSSLVVTTGRP